VTTKKTEEPAAEEARWWDEKPTSEWSIQKRMAWVTANVGTLEKDSKVSVGRGGSFKALSHDALVEAINPLIAEARIYPEPIFGESTEDQVEIMFYSDGQQRTKTGNRARVAVGYRFWKMDMDGPLWSPEGGGVVEFVKGRDYIEVGPLSVTAYDTSDKATGKAVSYSKKYVFRLAFNIATGDDVDSGKNYESAGPQRKSGQQQSSSAPTGASGKRPEPTLASSPHELGGEIPETAWQKIASVWNRDENGLSEKQRKLLYVRADKAHNWKHDEIKGVVKHHLGAPLEEVPNRKAFDGLLAVFESYKPSDLGFIGGDGGQDDIGFGPDGYGS